MTVRKGSKVWVDDRDLAWTAAEVVDYVGKQVQVLTVSGKKVGGGYELSVLFLYGKRKSFWCLISCFWFLVGLFVGFGLSGEAVSAGCG